MRCLFHVQECIPTLASFVSLLTDSSVQLAALQALTNLSVTPTHHLRLVTFVDSVVNIAKCSADIQLILQSLRLLVNLTSSSEFVEHMFRKQVNCWYLFICFFFVLFRLILARDKSKPELKKSIDVSAVTCGIMVFNDISMQVTMVFFLFFFLFLISSTRFHFLMLCVAVVTN